MRTANKGLIALAALIGAIFGLYVRCDAVQPVSGIGINFHETIGPVAKLQAIGIKWTRQYVTGERQTSAVIKAMLAQNKPLRSLWILPLGSDVVKLTKTYVGSGVTDIEVYNEPELHGVTPQEYARVYNIVRLVAGPKVRVYTSLSTWADAKWYLDAAIAAGMQIDVLGFHGYLTSPEGLPLWVTQAKSYGRPVVLTEVGFPDKLGSWAVYRQRFGGTVAQLFVRLKKALGSLAWCWYDGPNPEGDYGTGLFESGDGGASWLVPNVSYWQIAEMVR